MKMIQILKTKVFTIIMVLIALAIIAIGLKIVFSFKEAKRIHPVTAYDIEDAIIATKMSSDENIKQVVEGAISSGNLTVEYNPADTYLVTVSGNAPVKSSHCTFSATMQWDDEKSKWDATYIEWLPVPSLID